MLKNLEEGGTTLKLILHYSVWKRKNSQKKLDNNILDSYNFNR